MGLFNTTKPEPKRWQYMTMYILTGGTDSDHPDPVNQPLNILGSDGWELIQIVDDPRISETGRPLKMAYLKRELLWGVWDEDGPEELGED